MEVGVRSLVNLLVVDDNLLAGRLQPLVFGKLELGEDFEGGLDSEILPGNILRNAVSLDVNLAGQGELLLGDDFLYRLVGQVGRSVRENLLAMKAQDHGLGNVAGTEARLLDMLRIIIQMPVVRLLANLGRNSGGKLQCAGRNGSQFGVEAALVGFHFLSSLRKKQGMN